MFMLKKNDYNLVSHFSGALKMLAHFAFAIVHQHRNYTEQRRLFDIFDLTYSRAKNKCDKVTLRSQ